MSSSQSDHSLESSHSDRDTNLALIGIVQDLLPESCVELSGIVNAVFVEVRHALGLGERNILLEELTGHD